MRDSLQKALQLRTPFVMFTLDTDGRIDNWLDIAERGFNFAEKASDVFEKARKNGDIETCKEILSTLGSNLTLKDKKLCISWDNVLFPIKTMAEEYHVISDGFEPVKTLVNKRKMGTLCAQNPIMLRGQDSLLTGAVPVCGCLYSLR